MKKLLIITSVFLSTIILLNCSGLMGEEVARLSINEISRTGDHFVIKEAILELEKDDKISVWSKMDMSYEGNAMMSFTLEVLKDDERFDVLHFDPREKNITIGERKSVIMNKTKWSFTAKNASIAIDEKGTYTFRGIFTAPGNSNISVEKAEIILKK